MSIAADGRIATLEKLVADMAREIAALNGRVLELENPPHIDWDEAKAQLGPIQQPVKRPRGRPRKQPDA